MSPREFEFRDFQRRVRDFPFRRVFSISVVVLIVLVATAVMVSSFYTVKADAVGVVQRFGKHIATTGPGLHWKLPLGIDAMTPVEVDRVLKEEFGFRTTGIRGPESSYRKVPEESLMLTGDQNIADVEWIVQYKIKDPAKFRFNIADQEANIRDVSEATMRQVVGDSSVTEVLTARRREIALEVEKKLQEVLDAFDSGIDVLTVELQDVTPPKQVRDSFNEVNRARQEMETTINQARREYNRATRDAEGKALKLIQEAEGYKLKRVNEARGDAARFLKLLDEYQRAREVTRKRLYLETIAGVLPRLTHIYVLDGQAGGPLQILDLKEALGGASRGRTAPTSGAATSGN